MSLTPDQIEGLEALIEKLEEALEHFDGYEEAKEGKIGDDTPIFAEEDDVIFELAHRGGQLKIGDLRDVYNILKGTFT